MIGKQLLDVVTTGMYSDPLMVLREYFQNAADSIDSAVESDDLSRAEARIRFQIRGRDRSIVIEDNGAGMESDLAAEVLSGLGHSTKDRLQNRGFRGIGRLGGLGYCRKLVFETRSAAGADITEVVWDGESVQRRLHETLRCSISSLLDEVRNTTTRPPRSDDPERFFRVTMTGVHRFHKDELMDVRKVREYLGEVAAVPLDETQFPYAGEINSHLSGFPGYVQHSVQVNGERVYKPHRRVFELGREATDEVVGIQLFHFDDQDGVNIAKGWYAETGLRASIPPRERLRGIRVRQGDIQIGDEYLLAESFTERRFANWHIGEIHVSSALRPNARRDGFENNRAVEVFLEHATRLGQHLSRLCRASSKARSQVASVERQISEVERYICAPFFVDGEQHSSQETNARRALERLEHLVHLGHGLDKYEARVASARDSLMQGQKKTPLLRECLDAVKMHEVTVEELIVQVCRKIDEGRRVSQPLHELIVDVVRPFLQPEISASLD